MYQINPNSAMTELYGINKADAQVFDTRKFEEAAQNKQKEVQAQQKAKEDKLSNLMGDVSKIGKGEIRPADIDYFAGEQKKLYDDVKKAFSETKGGVLPIEKQVEFESRIADIQRKSLISGARFKEDTQSFQRGMLEPEADQDELNLIQQDMFDKSKGGNFNDPLPTWSKNINYAQRVSDKLVGQAIEQAKATDDGIGYSNTREQREKAIIDDLANPAQLKDAIKKFNKAEDKLGTNNPIDFYVKKYADELTVDFKHPPKSTSGGGGGGDENKKKIVGVMSKDAQERDVLSFDVGGSIDNQYNTVVDPVSKKTVEAKPLRIIYNKDKDSSPEMVFAVKPNKDQGIKGGEMTMTYGDTQFLSILKKYGLENIYDVLQGNEPSNWSISRPPKGDVKDGERKVYNGHEYTLVELKAMAKAAKKTDKEAETLWNSLK